MSVQSIQPELLELLSTEEQQLLAGGCGSSSGENNFENEGFGENGFRSNRRFASPHLGEGGYGDRKKVTYLKLTFFQSKSRQSL